MAINEVVDETLVNRSRFICYLYPCESAEQAKNQIKQLQQEHPQANHHCYAFIAKGPDNSQYFGFSDDGEPSGTAGRPMLSVLQGSKIGQICAVVVRYFGGTKLGTGGLQRAYGASVRQALLNIQTTLKIPMINKSLACQYTQVNDVLHLIESCGINIIRQDYQENVIFVLAIPLDQLTLVEERLITLSAGQLVLTSLAEEK